MTATNIIPLDTNPPEPKRFIEPSLSECVSHALSIGLPEKEATKFWHYNNARSWMLGKSKIRRWKSAMAIWRMNYGGTVQGITRTNTPSRADVIAFAKSSGDTTGFVIGFYERRLATNFANPEGLTWRELFSKEFNNWRLRKEL